MKCPVCSVDLNMMDRQGVEIDYCPKCRGIWLDRGELEKLIERTGDSGERSHYSEDHHGSHGESHHGKERRRQGFLARMMDFD
jgi:uncharacterized protein